MNFEQVRQYARAVAIKRGFPDTEEIIAEAALALVIASKRIASLSMALDNEDAYLQTWITGAVKRVMSKETKHAHVELMPSMAAYNLDYTKELIEALKLTPQEEKILNLRMQGYVDREIGEALELTPRRIAQVREEIGKKVGVIWK